MCYFASTVHIYFAIFFYWCDLYYVLFSCIFIHVF